MADFAYNNAKNINTGYILFELNFGFHLRVSYKNNVDRRSKSKTADKLVTELQTVISLYREYLQYNQELQKCYYDKHANPKSYTPGDKVWLN